MTILGFALEWSHFCKSTTIYRKGIRSKFLNQNSDIFKCGNTKEPRNVGGSPGKSSLFFLTVKTINYPGIRLTGDRVRQLVKHFNFWSVRCAFNDPWKSRGQIYFRVWSYS